jgi:DNA repair photolyase
MQVLAEHGIHTGLTMMPILPFIEDNEENVRQIVEQAHEHGAAYIIPSFGVTLRDRQRAYYYNRLDEQFPGLRQRYERVYGERYHCPVPDAEGLARVFGELCSRYGIATRMTPYQPGAAKQLSLF